MIRIGSYSECKTFLLDYGWTEKDLSNFDDLCEITAIEKEYDVYYYNTEPDVEKVMWD